MKKEFFEKLGIDEKSIKAILAEQAKEYEIMQSNAAENAKRQQKIHAAVQNSGTTDAELLELLIVGAEDIDKAIEEAKTSHPGLFSGDYPIFSVPSEGSLEQGLSSFRIAAGLK